MRQRHHGRVVRGYLGGTACGSPRLTKKCVLCSPGKRRSRPHFAPHFDVSELAFEADATAPAHRARVGAGVVKARRGGGGGRKFSRAAASAAPRGSHRRRLPRSARPRSGDGRFRPSVHPAAAAAPPPPPRRAARNADELAVDGERKAEARSGGGGGGGGVEKLLDSNHQFQPAPDVLDVRSDEIEGLFRRCALSSLPSAGVIGHVI